MHGTNSLKLFKHGPSVEVRLAILLLLSLAMIFVDAHWSYLAPVRKLVSTAIYPFQRVVMAPRQAVDYFDSWNQAASKVRAEQEAIRSQRIEMAQLLSHSVQLSAENEQLRRLLGVSEAHATKSVAVEVFYVPANAFSQRLIFNKGTSDGIAPGMPVIDEGGVVGQIVRVAPYTSEAALLTDDHVSIPVQVLRNGLRLIAFGSNKAGKIEVRYLVANADIQVDDMLVTSGIGGMFPAGLQVGRVETIERDPGSGFAKAIAEPLSHPERYRHFLVLLVDPVDEPMLKEIQNAQTQ